MKIFPKAQLVAFILIANTGCTMYSLPKVTSMEPPVADPATAMAGEYFAPCRATLHFQLWYQKQERSVALDLLQQVQGKSSYKVKTGIRYAVKRINDSTLEFTRYHHFDQPDEPITVTFNRNGNWLERKGKDQTSHEYQDMKLGVAESGELIGYIEGRPDSWSTIVHSGARVLSGAGDKSVAIMRCKPYQPEELRE